MPREKLSQEVRDAFRAYRYHMGQTVREIKGASPTDVSLIENNGSVSPEKALRIIKTAWGFDSFALLLEAASDLPQPEEKESLSQEVRDAFRAFRYYTGQSSRMLQGTSAVDISHIETGESISPEKALQVIKAAWGFESFEALIAAAKDLPQPPIALSKKVRDAFRAFRYFTGQTSPMLGVSPYDISRIENGGVISPIKALDVIKAAWGFESFKALIDAAQGLPQPPQELTHEVRNAFRKYRYHRHQSTRAFEGANSTEISNIENDGSIAPAKVLTIIETNWGFDSFEALVDAASELPDPPERAYRKTSGRGRGQG